MKARKTKREKPKFPWISEEMKQWSATLGRELTGWPQVSTKPMFGMLGYFRRKKIFAALPVSRGLTSPNSLIFRLKPFPAELLERAKNDPRISTGRNLPEAKWLSFELSSEEDLRGALWWLNQTYERTK